jgi:flagellar basal-body rod protein FlgC
MFGSLDISASGLAAQRVRLDVISANLANQHTTFDAQGNFAPFRRRIAVFAEGGADAGGLAAGKSPRGVHVREILLDSAPFKRVYEPTHPNADAAGYVQYPNVDPTMETINSMEALRAYDANITAAEATKSMLNAALRLLA